MQDERADELIERYIELDPNRPSKAEARLKGYNVKVWALAGHSRVVDGDIDQVAHDYDLPREAVEAALAFSRATARSLTTGSRRTRSDSLWPRSTSTITLPPRSRGCSRRRVTRRAQRGNWESIGSKTTRCPAARLRRGVFWSVTISMTLSYCTARGFAGPDGGASLIHMPASCLSPRRGPSRPHVSLAS